MVWKWLEDFGGAIKDNAGPLALGAAGLAMTKEGYDKLGRTGQRAYEGYAGPGGLADRLTGMMDFQPYTVTSTTGSQFGMSPSPSVTGGQGFEYFNTGMFSDEYNEANSSPEVRAAFSAGASPQASASMLAAFNMGVEDANRDGLISDEEFAAWEGYDNWLAENPNHPRGDDAPGRQPGSRFTGQYNADGTPIYVQTRAASAATGSAASGSAAGSGGAAGGAGAAGSAAGSGGAAGGAGTGQGQGFEGGGGPTVALTDSGRYTIDHPAFPATYTTSGIDAIYKQLGFDKVFGTAPARFQGEDDASYSNRTGFALDNLPTAATGGGTGSTTGTGGGTGSTIGTSWGSGGAATGGGSGEALVPGANNYGFTLSPEELAMQNANFTRAENMFALSAANPATREQAVFDRMMTAMAPQQERERLALEERLAGQGRLGVRTSMFGGTSEQLAQAKAQEESRNEAMLNAMTFAGQEQQRQANLGSGLMAAGYVPQAQLLNVAGLGMTAAEQRRAQLAQQASTYGETYSTGLEALLSSALGQAGMTRDVGAGLTTAALGGLFS